MYDIEFKYADGSNEIFEGVTKIICRDTSPWTSIEGEEILTAFIPLGELHLYSPTVNCTISGSNVTYIKIIKR